MARRPPEPHRLEVEEDEEEWDEDEEVDFDLTAPPDDDSEQAMAELLLELTINVVRLRLLMEEADEGEYKAAFKRLRAFREEISRLPEGPEPSTPMGFKTGG